MTRPAASARSRLMRAVRECPTIQALRAECVQIACDLPDTGRDTIPCAPPDYAGEFADAAPPTPVTMRSPALPDFGGVL